MFRAAQYVRMSTEHQQYSTENQGDKIREYAARRNIEIVRTYADEGKSGLRIDGRQALQQLIADVQAGKADFQIILVYDVSRWGRFQDADESAYYEYICRRAGIQVAYCAEQFENDGSPVSTIVKGVKRAMAGEYLSGLIIDEAEGMPSSAAYAHRFGSLIRAYQTVGFTPDRDYQYLEVNQFLRRLHPEIVGETERMIAEVGGAVVRDPVNDLLTVNREFTVSLVLSRCQLLDNGRRRWKVRFDTSLTPDITVAVRLDETNQAPLDYYLLPRLDFGQPRIHLADHNGIEFESYRFDSLDYLYSMAERSRLRRVA